MYMITVHGHGYNDHMGMPMRRSFWVAFAALTHPSHRSPARNLSQNLTRPYVHDHISPSPNPQQPPSSLDHPARAGSLGYTVLQQANVNQGVSHEYESWFKHA